MTPERWQELQRVLDEAFALPETERQAFLVARCPDETLRREALSLLAAAESSNLPLDGPSPGHLPSGKDPVRVGPYCLLERIGHGGMGTVWIARRVDQVHHQKVAVKLLQWGLEGEEATRRFQREREILAQLEHPNIARLLDGGTAEDGRPYLVMERIEGLPVHRYCEEHDLDVPARLRLFQKICTAVHFAHQNLVVHRDIKPANILVTEDGEPKLLDFGIAKLLSTENFPLTVVPTAPGRAPMTPAWASPEQLRGEHVVTATDIYSLGVLLFHLLTGKTPYSLDGLSYLQVVRAVSDREPPLASNVVRAEDSPQSPDLVRRLTGDLDSILLRALRQDPTLRYSSAEHFAQDIERHLTGLPVLARQGTFLYRSRKFVARNRVGVAVAATILGLLLTFLVTLLDRERQITAERDRFERTAGFLTQLFAQPDPKGANNPDLRAREVLDRGAQEIHSLADQPQVQADMRIVIGRSYFGLGLYEAATREIEEALHVRRATLPEGHVQIGEALALLGQVESDRGRLELAEVHLREALDIFRRAHTAPHPELAEGQFRLAWILERRGAYEEAKPLYRTALEQIRVLDEPELLAEILNGLGILLREQASYDESEALLRESLALRRERFGELHALTLGSSNSLGLLLQARGQLDEAEQIFRQALEQAQSLFEGPHKTTATLLANLGGVLSRKGRHEEAEPFLRRAIHLTETLRFGDHPDLATYLGQLAHVEQQLGRGSDAIETARQALAMRRRLFGDHHKDVALSCDHLARTLAAQKQYDEAEAYFLEALTLYEHTVGRVHPLRAKTLNNLASLHYQKGDTDTARQLFHQALDLLTTIHGDAHPEVGVLSFNLAYLHHGAGDTEAAEALYAQAETSTRQTLGERHSRVGFILTWRGTLQLESGRPGDAEALAREALDILAESDPFESSRRHRAEVLLAKSLAAQDRPEEAAQVLEERLRHALAEAPDAEVTRELEALRRSFLEES